MVNVESPQAAHPLYPGRADLGVQVHAARRSTDYPDHRASNCRRMVRTTENKIYRQGIKDAKELEDGFPAKPEELFAYQGLIIGGVEAGYFTRAAAAGDSRFRRPARRRPPLHRRTRELQRRRVAEFAHGGPDPDPAAGGAQRVPSRFLIGGADRSRARRACSCRLDENPGEERRSVEEDPADRQLSGYRRAETGRDHAAGSDPAGEAARSRCW